MFSSAISSNSSIFTRSLLQITDEFWVGGCVLAIPNYSMTFSESSSRYYYSASYLLFKRSSPLSSVKCLFFFREVNLEVGVGSSALFIILWYCSADEGWSLPLIIKVVARAVSDVLQKISSSTISSKGVGIGGDYSFYSSKITSSSTMIASLAISYCIIILISSNL